MGNQQNAEIFLKGVSVWPWLKNLLHFGFNEWNGRLQEHPQGEETRNRPFISQPFLSSLSHTRSPWTVGSPVSSCCLPRFATCGPSWVGQPSNLYLGFSCGNIDSWKRRPRTQTCQREDEPWLPVKLPLFPSPKASFVPVPSGHGARETALCPSCPSRSTVGVAQAAQADFAPPWPEPSVYLRWLENAIRCQLGERQKVQREAEEGRPSQLLELAMVGSLMGQCPLHCQ